MKNENTFSVRKKIDFIIVGTLLFLEVVLFSFLFSGMLLEHSFAAVGSPNATISTTLQVGTVPPEILNVTIRGGAIGVDLSANSTVIVDVYAIIRDFNGENDTINASVDFFDDSVKNYGDSPDNNDYYVNTSCAFIPAYGDEYLTSVNCTLAVNYYAFNSSFWNATLLVVDNSSRNATNSDTIAVNTLLAVGLPGSIDFGTVNATSVSAERIANVTNFGNVMINISLSGYASRPGDNLSMNCSLGSIKNISIYYAKYNVTDSNTSALTLPEFDSLYLNLTRDPVVRPFGLNFRRDDTNPFLDDTNSTYWRMYVPLGVAGTCNGNIVIGATQASGV